MSTIRWAAAVVWAGLAVGCVPTEKPKIVEAQPTRLVSLEEASTIFKHANPLAQIGVVAAVLPDHNMVAVSDLPEHAVARGDSVTIIDATPNFNPIADAKVDTFNDRWVMVKYSQPRGRAPRAGDFMILVPLLPSVPGRTPEATPPSTAPVGTVEIPAAPTPPAVPPPAVTPPATVPAATPDTPATTPPAVTPPAVTPPTTAPAATPDTPATTPPAVTPPTTAPAATPDTPATPATTPTTAPAATDTSAPKTDAGNAKPPELNK